MMVEEVLLSETCKSTQEYILIDRCDRDLSNGDRICREKKWLSGFSGRNNGNKVVYSRVYMYVIMMVEGISLCETCKSTLDYVLIDRVDSDLSNNLIKTTQP
jgi:hypothetical protein